MTETEHDAYMVIGNFRGSRKTTFLARLFTYIIDSNVWKIRMKALDVAAADAVAYIS